MKQQIKSIALTPEEACKSRVSNPADPANFFDDLLSIRRHGWGWAAKILPGGSAGRTERSLSPCTQRIFYLIAMWLWLVVCPSARSMPANGDFELGSTTFWSVWNPANQPFQWGTTGNRTNVHSGNYAGALTQFGGTTNVFHVISANVNVSSWPAGSLCLGTLYLKTVNLQTQQGLGVVMIFSDSGGNVVGYYPMNGYYTGDHDYLPVQVLATLPTGATSASFHLVLGSGITAGALYVDDVEIHQVTSLGNLSTNIPDCRVLRDTNGSPRLYINGEVQNPSFFFGNHGSPLIYDEIRLAAEVGVNLIMPSINTPWGGVGSGEFELSLQSNSNAWFLPRVYLHPPASWTASHSDQALVDEKGAPDANGWPSLASDVWMQAVSNQLQQLVLYFHNSPYRSRIIGYHLCYLAGGEWFYEDPAFHFWDYSEVNRQRFITWLQTKYTNDIAALNSAWHKSYASFALVQIPSTNDWFSADDGVFRNPLNQRAAPDYSAYHNQLVAGRIAELSGYVKTLTGGKSVVGAFYGYTAELIGNCWHNGLPVAGHLGLEQLLTSPDVDLVGYPISYFDRGVGRPGNMHSSGVDSVALAGKLSWQEEDSNTYVVTPPSNSNPWYTNVQDTMQCLRRDYGIVMGHNQAMEWMDLTPDGRLNSSSIWTNNALVMGTYNDVITNQMPFAPQIAVLVDEQTFFWLTADVYHLTYPNTYAIRSVFHESGASVGYYLLKDLANLPTSVKLVVFENAFRLDAAGQTMISQAKTNGRTFLWLYAPGYISETNLSVNTMQTATGFKFVRSAVARSTSIKVTNTISPITSDLVNHQYGNENAITPNFYVDRTVGNPEVLGSYPNNSNRPGLVAKDYGTWKSVFSGGLDLDVQMVRSIARYAGVNLLAEGDTLNATNAVNFNGNYMYVYAMNNAGRRCFQLPGEKVPNGNFEKFTGALPTSGFGRWVSPLAGLLPASRVVGTNAAVGSNACATGPFLSVPGQYSVPLGIRLQAESNKTYQVSCDIYVDGLNTVLAGGGDYIFFVFQPHDYSADSWNAAIASGTSSLLPNKTWKKLQGSFTFKGSAAPYQNELNILLKVYGAYSITNLMIDNVSVRETGCVPVDVFDVTQNAAVAFGVTSWAADFDLNEQKIFRMVPTSPGPFGITSAALASPGWLQVQWQPLGPNYRYTLEQSGGLPPTWQSVTGTNVWPIQQTQATVPIDSDQHFFRVKAESL